MVSRQLFSVVNEKSARHRGKILSIVAHVLVLLCFVGGFHTAPRIAPFRLRGTAKGVSLMTYYSPGSLRPTPSSTSHVKKLERTSPVASRHALSAPEPEKLQKTKTESGVGSSIESGVGEGDITAALAPYSQWESPRLCRGGSSSLTFPGVHPETLRREPPSTDRKSTRLNSSHLGISYAVFCLKK